MKQRKPNSRDRLKKIPVMVYLDPPQAKALRALSDRSHIPAQVFFRAGLDHILAAYAKTGSLK